MRKENRRITKRVVVLILAGMTLLTAVACGKGEDPGINLLPSVEGKGGVVNLFSPMEKTDPKIGRAHV